MSVNKVIIIGRLGRKPEQRSSNSGNAITTFSVATSERRKDPSGEWGESTEWHNIVCFGRTAELAGTYLDKGRQVYLEGRLQTRKYDKEGQTHYRTEIIANNIQFLGGRDDVSDGGGYSSRASKPQKSAPAPSFSDSAGDSDIPF